jgi:hypothetical protein
MKSLLIICSLILTTAVSAQALRLDASCKLTCSYLEEISDSPGFPTANRSQVIFQDFLNMTRQEIEVAAGRACGKKIKEAVSSKVDCAFFKH